MLPNRQVAVESGSAESMSSFGDIIVGGDDVVEAGDAKLADLLRIYSEESGEASDYRQAIQARGFDTSRFKQPVLVRRRLNALTPEERIAFIRSYDDSQVGSPDALINTAYGPRIAHLIGSALPVPVAEALRYIAADWHHLRLAAKEGAPWMEATPALHAAVTATAHSHAAREPVGVLVLEGELADTGFTEAAYGFLRLMYADAELTQEAPTSAIVDRLKACILTLETQGPTPVRAPADGSEPASSHGPAAIADRAAAVLVRASGWGATPMLETARLSATTDFDALRQVAALNDLPAIRLMNRWIERSGGDSDASAPTGAIAEMWLVDMGQLLRRQLAETVDPTAVVDRILVVANNAFALEALACLGAHRAIPFDDFHPDLRAAFARHGLDAEAWRRFGNAAATGMVDPALLADGDMERLSAMVAQAPKVLFELDQEAFPVSSMAGSLTPALRRFANGPFAPLFPSAIAMTAIAILALQLKRRLRNESELDLRNPQAWVSAFQQSGAARLVGDLMAKMGDAVDGFAHGGGGSDLGGQLARFLQTSATGGPVWYARRGADRLLWEALQRGRGRDIGAAYARMARRHQSEVLPAKI